MARKPNSDSKPWLALRMLVSCALILVSTYWSYEERTALRWVIVVLYFFAAWTCMLKEMVPYGIGDRIAIWLLWIILALSVVALLVSQHPYSFLSVFSIIVAVIMLRQSIKNARKRWLTVEPF